MCALESSLLVKISVLDGSGFFPNHFFLVFPFDQSISIHPADSRTLRCLPRCGTQKLPQRRQLRRQFLSSSSPLSPHLIHLDCRAVAEAAEAAMLAQVVEARWGDMDIILHGCQAVCIHITWVLAWE